LPDRKVFISYATEDGLDYAVLAKQAFETLGISAFLEKHDVQRGSPAWIIIGEEIDRCHIFVLIGTSRTYDSYGVRLELNTALNLRKPVVTLKHDESKILHILYGPKHSRFSNENELRNECSKIAQRFGSIIEEHRKHMLGIARDATAQHQPVAPPVLASQPSKEILGDTSGLDPTKVRNAEDSIVRTYEAETIVPHVSRTRKFDPMLDRREDLTQIGVRLLLPVDGFLANVSPPVFAIVDDIGKGVALGEWNFINRDLLNRGVQVEIADDELQMEKLRVVVSDLRDQGWTPDVMFAPIKYYMRVHLDWMKKDPRAITWPYSRDGPFSAIVNVQPNTQLKLFWSNMYVPLDDFVIFDSAVGEWVSEPDADTGHRLTVRVARSPLYPEKRVDILAKTIAQYKLRSPEGVRVLKVKT